MSAMLVAFVDRCSRAFCLNHSCRDLITAFKKDSWIVNCQRVSSVIWSSGASGGGRSTVG